MRVCQVLKCSGSNTLALVIWAQQPSSTGLRRFLQLASGTPMMTDLRALALVPARK
jgi:hypothetical protein